MPLSQFLILAGGVVATLGLFIGWASGSPGEDPGSRAFTWAAILCFGLLVGPPAVTVRFQKLTRNMALFALIGGGLTALVFVWGGKPAGGSFLVAWVLVLLGALAMVSGGVMGTRDPPHLE